MARRLWYSSALGNYCTIIPSVLQAPLSNQPTKGPRHLRPHFSGENFSAKIFFRNFHQVFFRREKFSPSFLRRNFLPAWAKIFGWREIFQAEVFDWKENIPPSNFCEWGGQLEKILSWWVFMLLSSNYSYIFINSYHSFYFYFRSFRTSGRLVALVLRFNLASLRKLIDPGIKKQL